MFSRSSGDGYDYVREHYRSDFAVGDPVVVNGYPGHVAQGRGDQYIWVMFDSDATGHRPRNCHPTWKLEVLR